MNCNLTNEERNKFNMRCRSFDCEPCNEWHKDNASYSDLLKESNTFLEKTIIKLRKKLFKAIEQRNDYIEKYERAMDDEYGCEPEHLQIIEKLNKEIEEV